MDGQRIITSRESIVADDVPGSIAIIGGGAIGVEFAYIYRMYGADVTIIELLPRIVPNEDEEISQQLERAFTRHGIKMQTGAGVTAAQPDATGVTLTIEKDGATETARFDKVLVAIGVQPNTEDLGLESVGVATDRGYVTIDDRMATNVPGIYAVGDVTGKLALAHVAFAQGVTAVEAIAGEETQPLDYTFMPRATYCHPQVASFGLTEAQAREQGYDVKIGRFNVQGSGKAVAMGENDGLVKLVIDANYGELLGGHMCGPEVTELLAELQMTHLLEGTTLELGWAVHAHPSVAEMVHEAALDAEGPPLPYVARRPHLIQTPRGSPMLKAADVPELTKTDLLGFYRQMKLIREFERESERQYTRGNIKGFLHVYNGEEAIAVGAINTLREDDYIVTHYRDHGQALARGMGSKEVMAELMGIHRLQQRQGRLHALFSSERNFMGGYAIVGGQLCIAAGIGLASSIGATTRWFFAFSRRRRHEGEFHEAMNLAAIWNLPVIFFCEHNLYGMGASSKETLVMWDPSRDGRPYGMDRYEVDGNDVLEVRDLMQKINAASAPARAPPSSSLAPTACAAIPSPTRPTIAPTMK